MNDKPRRKIDVPLIRNEIHGQNKKVCYMNITLSHFLSNITIRIHNNPLITMYTIRAFICGRSKDYVFLKISSFTNSVLIRSNTSNRRKSRVINWLHYLLNSLSDEEILPGFILTTSFKQTIANIVQSDSIVFTYNKFLKMQFTTILIIIMALSSLTNCRGIVDNILAFA